MTYENADHARQHVDQWTRENLTVGLNGELVRLVGSSSGDVTEDWQEPKPLPSDLRPVQTFSYELLPDSLCAWIQDAAERFQCAPDYLAVGAVVAAGSLIGRRMAIRPKQKNDWTEFGNLWGLIIGRPGAMKSPAVSEATRFLRKFEFKATEEYGVARKDHVVALERFDVKKRHSQSKAAAKNESDILTSADAPIEPVCKRYIVNDATFESLHTILQENPAGVLALRDEVSGLLRNLDKEEFASTRAFFLESWAGNAIYTFDRIGRGRNLVARINLSLLGGAQPARIADFVRTAVKGHAGDDGLLQRFGITVWPDDQGEWKDVDRWPDSSARTAAETAFTNLLRLNPIERGGKLDPFDGEDAVPYLRFDDAAQDHFNEWQTDLMKELRSGDLHPVLESHLSKFKKLVPSLSLAFHLLDGGSGPVNQAALLRAVAWTEYLRTHAERLYGSATSGEVKAARSILAKIRSRSIEYNSDSKRKAFDARTVYRAGWAGLDREATYSGLDLLVDLNYLRKETIQTKTNTAHLWLVNPRVAP